MNAPPDFTYRCICGGGMHIDPFFAGRLTICTRCSTPVLIPKTEGEVATEPDFDLATARLRLAPVRKDEWRDLVPVCSDPENHRFEIKPPQDKGDVKKMIRISRYPAGFRRSRILRFTARSKENSSLVGMASIAMDPAFLVGAIGLVIHHPYWGKGFGTELVGEIVSCLFREVRLHRLEASCDARNEACIRVFEKCGFETEGRVRHAFYHWERGWIDKVNFGLIHPREDSRLG